VEALEIIRWLWCGNLRVHRGHGLRIQIPFVVAISDSSTDSNFNRHNGAGISDSSTDGDLNGDTGANISDSSTDGNSNGDNNAAVGYSYGSFDNSDHASQPTAAGANCQIHGNSNNDCAW